MNGHPAAILKLSPTRGGLATALRLMPGAAMACALGACVDIPKYAFSPPPVDAASPIAAQVEAASESNAPYPKFSKIPLTTPTDVRPANAWTNNIYDTLRLKREQAALAEIYPQTLFDPDAFAKAAKASVAIPANPDPEAPGTSAKPTAAAKSGGKAKPARATPPSPAD